MKYKVGDKVRFVKECAALVSGDVIPVNSVWEVKSDLDEYYRIERADKQLVAMIESKVAEDCCEKINTAPSITKRINDKHNILNGLLNSDGSVDGEKQIDKLEDKQMQIANGVLMREKPQRPTESASTPASTGRDEKFKVGDNVQFVRTLSFPSGGYIKKGTVWEIAALNDTRYTLLLVDGEEGVKGIGYNINSALDTINSYCEKVEESDSEECFGTPEGEANEITNNGNTIRPGYYQSAMGDVFDIADAYGLDMPCGMAVKYILRAGKKDKTKEIEDLQKAIRCIERAIELRKE